ncbi:MAG: ATP-binding protein [Prevotellaceae bacterium]|jgi:hypothetical protein|nr:ATP-binding protein [Prevotellaceae bacterium]
MKTPFQYGKLAEEGNFVNRINEKKTLKTNLQSGINTMLISPRRLGKSSLVKQAMKELQVEDNLLKICFIDAFTILTEEEFYKVFVQEIIKSTSSQWKNWVNTAKEFLKSFSPRISFGNDPMMDFSIGIDFKMLKENELEILNLPEKIAKEKNIKIIVCIDEFQNLARIGSYDVLEKKMRSVWQHQQNVTYCFYGSKRHMMMDIFNSTEKPFYRFGQIMFLSKIAENEWINFIVNKFTETGKVIAPELAKNLVNEVELHSWYVQQLAHFVWNMTDNEVDNDILQQAIGQVIETNLPFFKTEAEALSATQMNFLVAVARGERNFNSKETMEKYGLGTPSNITKNKKLLQRKDFLDKTQDGFQFLDPIFKKWLLKEYEFTN